VQRDEDVPFEICRPRRGVGTPLLCHVPHSATNIPARWRGELALAELQSELRAMTDHYTDALFEPPATNVGGVAFVNRVGRLVCDPERFEDDELETMSRKGMGAVYTLTADGRPLRHPGYSTAARETVLGELFRPYADALATEVADQLQRFGRCLIIDAHSFPSSGG
jgi:N-formylglutamate amidohydrolase